MIHNIDPVWDENSKVLVLGSFPSPKSRSSGFFYGHPQNRFWKILSAVFEEDTPSTIDEKKTFLLSHGIALWDVLGKCDIVGADDSTIENAEPNDLSAIKANVRAVFTTGKVATRYYEEYFGKKSIYLPSPSPANRAVSDEKMIEEYKKIKLALEGE